MFTEDIDGECRPKVIKFVCKRCETGFIGIEPIRRNDGKYCHACHAVLLAENHRSLRSLATGNRLRLMLGQTMLHEPTQTHGD